MRSPVAVIIFNRPRHTARVLAEVAKAHPQKLLVIADGPRPDRPDDEQSCAETRALVDKVNWECDVVKNYSDVNLGCGRRPATGIRWVFDQVEQAVILEDDCVPHPSFFPYCDELLDHFRHDHRVMHISGNNFIAGERQPADSYLFSNYTLSWGWATWRRAFTHFDAQIEAWPKLRGTPWLLDVLGNPAAVTHWEQIFDKTYGKSEEVTWWDFQWLFACWAQRGLSVLPKHNLVSNIGFGIDASHTKNLDDPLANAATAEMTFPLVHPDVMIRDLALDQMIFERHIRPPKKRRNLLSTFRDRCTEALPTPARRLGSSLKAAWQRKS